MGRESEGKTGLDDVLDAVIRELGSPQTLREVGVGREKLAGLAVAENRLRRGPTGRGRCGDGEEAGADDGEGTSAGNSWRRCCGEV